MKKRKWFSAFPLIALTLCLSTLGSSLAQADGQKAAAPDIIVENTEVNAVSNVVSIPDCYVYDSVDVGLTATASVKKGDKDYSVVNGQFTADETGVYQVTYKAVNSAGMVSEKTVDLTVTDTLAPQIKTNGDAFTCYFNKSTALPKIYVEDFYDTIVTANIVKDGTKTPVADTFVISERGICELEITATEDRPGGLSSTVNLTLNVVNKGAIYGFNDLGSTNGIWWGTVQAGNGTSDPNKYQVPVISENTDDNYVHDADGKSFKVEIEGRDGMSNSNSWPAIYTAELNMYAAKNNDYLVAWVYNDSEDYDTVKINLQLNNSNSYTVAVNAKRGEWTQIRFLLDAFNGKKGNSSITSVKFWISGFVEGKVTYYIDDLYFE